ncbi:MAG: hypothetical protein WAO23_03740 [Dethiobacteria bacterium]
MRRTIFIIAVSLLVIILALGGCATEEAGPDATSEDNQQTAEKPDYGHAHGGDYEWSALYNLSAGTYTLELGPGKDASSILLLFLTEIPGKRAQQDHLALHLMEHEADKVTEGESFNVKDRGLYELSLKSQGTAFSFEVTEAARYIIYAEHDASELIKVLDESNTEVKGENPQKHN